MLKKSARLSAADIATVRRVGRRAASRHFLLVIDERCGKSGFAVAAAKGGVIKSVERNRLRRRVYHVLRTATLPRLPRPACVLVSAKAGAYDLPFKDLHSELTNLFLQARLV